MDQSVRLLIVEDDVIAQMTLCKMLNEMGYINYKTANNYESALELLATGEIDIILLDIFLKGKKTGLEIAKDASLPILFITASTDKATYDEMLALPNIGILRKPYEYKQIKECIEQYLKKLKKQEKRGFSDELDKMIAMVFDTAKVGICVTDAKRRFVKVNEAYCRLYGYTEQELIGNEFTMVVPDDKVEYARDLHNRYIAGLTEESAGEWKVKVRNGSLKDIWVTTGRLQTNTGQTFKVTTVTDISQQKDYVRKLEKLVNEKEVLMKELHHRVKNNLNQISGLLYLQDKSNETALEDARVRINTLSLIHEKLYASNDLSEIDIHEYFKELIDHIKMTVDHQKNIEIAYNIESHKIGSDVAITLGLILNEAISNCFKHAFPNDISGNIWVEFKVMLDGYLLYIKDDGVGFNKTQVRQGSLGLKLVENLVENGEFHIDSGNTGTTCKIQLPFGEGKNY